MLFCHLEFTSQSTKQSAQQRGQWQCVTSGVPHSVGAAVWGGWTVPSWPSVPPCHTNRAASRQAGRELFVQGHFHTHKPSFSLQEGKYWCLLFPNIKYTAHLTQTLRAHGHQISHPRAVSQIHTPWHSAISQNVLLEQDSCFTTNMVKLFIQSYSVITVKQAWQYQSWSQF